MTTHSAPLRTIGTHPNAVGARPKQARVRHSTPWAFFVIIVIIAFFGLIYSRISLDNSAFSLDDIEEQIAEQESLHSGLRLEVAELRNPQRIADAAAGLGLVFPEERVDLAVDPVDGDAVSPEHRWAQIQALLSAQP